MKSNKKRGLNSEMNHAMTMEDVIPHLLSLETWTDEEYGMAISISLNLLHQKQQREINEKE
jgi:hypothetical protein